MTVLETDIVIVGGGSAGFGAAIRAARLHPQARIELIDSMDRLGGTSTVGGVNNWEPGIGGLGVHYELYDRMKARGAIGVGKSVHEYHPSEPYGLSRIDWNESYESSLRGSGQPNEKRRRVHFDADEMASVMEAMLLEAGNVRIHYRTRLEDVTAEGNLIQSITVSKDGAADKLSIKAKVYIDCSGGVVLARKAGCESAYGEDPFDRYEEPSAPENPQPNVNGVTLVYRVEKTEEPEAQEKPCYEESALDEQSLKWPLEKTRVAFITDYPNGDLCFNLLPVMQGNEYHQLPPEQARAICEGRGLAHWHWFKRTQRFTNYRFNMHFPLVGVRESYRLVGRYVLVEQDVRDGIHNQNYKEQVIAFADHSLDTHGQTNVKKPLNKQLERPYGIPYPCLLPKEINNLIVATRGASFSHIAASSCRLSRSMMALGEAAGVAAAMAVHQKTTLPEVSVEEIRRILRIPEMLEKINQVWSSN